MTTPADIDRAGILAWLEAEQQHTRVIAEAATKKHLRQIFEDEDHGPGAGRRQSQLVGRYVALAYDADDDRYLLVTAATNLRDDKWTYYIAGTELWMDRAWVEENYPYCSESVDPDHLSPFWVT